MGKRFDPLLRDIELPCQAMFYPAGFPLHLSTNSHHVLEAANESWRYWEREFDVEPITFRVVIGPEGDLAGEPVFRMQEHLLHVVSDAHNFGAADTRALFAALHLSEKTAADHGWLRWFYLEAMAYFLLSQRYVAAVHAACVARDGAGLMLCGKSSSGKSTLAFACARAGWTYVADDCIWLLPESTDRIAIGKPHQVRFRHDAPLLFPELAGYVARTRPNGKLSIEVPTSLFPGMATAKRAPIAGLVFLDRENAGAPHAEPMASQDAVDLLLRDMPSYGPEVNAMHERTLGALRDVPAWRMRYRTVEEGVGLLAGIGRG